MFHLEMYTYCPSDPQICPLELLTLHDLLNGYVYRVLGLTLGCLVPYVFASDVFLYFILRSSLQVHFLIKLIKT